MLIRKENQNLNAQENNRGNQIDEVDVFLNSPGDYLRLPKRDGESVTYQFFNDKTKRRETFEGAKNTRTSDRSKHC